MFSFSLMRSQVLIWIESSWIFIEQVSKGRSLGGKIRKDPPLCRIPFPLPVDEIVSCCPFTLWRIAFKSIFCYFNENDVAGPFPRGISYETQLLLWPLLAAHSKTPVVLKRLCAQVCVCLCVGGKKCIQIASNLNQITSRSIGKQRRRGEKTLSAAEEQSRSSRWARAALSAGWLLNGGEVTAASGG